MANSAGTSNGSFKISDDISYNAATDTTPQLVVVGVGKDCFEKGNSKYLHGIERFFTSEKYAKAYRSIQSRMRLAVQGHKKLAFAYTADTGLDDNDAMELLALPITDRAWSPADPAFLSKRINTLATAFTTGLLSGFDSIAIPPLGCDGGGLNYYEDNGSYPGVFEMIKEAFQPAVSAGKTVYLLPTSSRSSSGIGGIYQDDKITLNYEIKQASDKNELDNATAVATLMRKGMRPPSDQWSYIAAEFSARLEKDGDSKIIPGTPEYKEALDLLVAEYNEKYKATLSEVLKEIRDRRGDTPQEVSRLVLSDYYDIVADYKERESEIVELNRIINSNIDYDAAIAAKKRELLNTRAALGQFQSELASFPDNIGTKTQIRASEFAISTLEDEIVALEKEAVRALSAEGELDRLIQQKLASSTEKDKLNAEERLEKSRPSSRRVTSMRVGRPEVERYRQACELAEKAEDKVDEAERVLESAIKRHNELAADSEDYIRDMVTVLVTRLRESLERAEKGYAEEVSALRVLSKHLDDLERDGVTGMALKGAKKSLEDKTQKVAKAKKAVEAAREKLAESAESRKAQISDIRTREYNELGDRVHKARAQYKDASVGLKNAQSRVIETRKAAAPYMRSAAWDLDSLTGYKELKQLRINEAKHRLAEAEERVRVLEDNPSDDPYALPTAKEDAREAYFQLKYVERKKAKKMRFATSASDLTLSEDERQAWLRSIEEREGRASVVERPHGLYESRYVVPTEAKRASVYAKRDEEILRQIEEREEERDLILRRYELLGGDSLSLLAEASDLAGENILNPSEHRRARSDFAQSIQGGDILLEIADLEAEYDRLTYLVGPQGPRDVYGTLEDQLPRLEKELEKAEEKLQKAQTRYEGFGKDPSSSYYDVVSALNATQYGAFSLAAPSSRGESALLMRRPPQSRRGRRITRWQSLAIAALESTSQRSAAIRSLVKQLVSAISRGAPGPDADQTMEDMLTAWYNSLDNLEKQENAVADAQGAIIELKQRIAQRGGAFYSPPVGLVGFTPRELSPKQRAFLGEDAERRAREAEDKATQKMQRKLESMTPVERIQAKQRIGAPPRQPAAERPPAGSYAEHRAQAALERQARAAERMATRSPMEAASESEASIAARIRAEQRRIAESKGYSSIGQMEAEEARRAPEAVSAAARAALERVDLDIQRAQRDLNYLSPEDRNYNRVIGMLDRYKSRRDDITFADISANILVLTPDELRQARAERVRDLEDYLTRMGEELGFSVQSLKQLTDILRSSGTLPQERYPKLVSQIQRIEQRLEQRLEQLSERQSNPSSRRGAAAARLEARRTERLARRSTRSSRRSNPPWSESGSDVLEIFASTLRLEIDAGGMPTSIELEKRRLAILSRLTPNIRLRLSSRPDQHELNDAAHVIADHAREALERGSLSVDRAEPVIEAALSVG